MISRRNALSVLGLASAASSALAAEDFMVDRGEANPKRLNTLPTSKDVTLIHKGLRALADEMEAGAVTAHRLHVSTEIKRDQLIMQVLTVEFFIPVTCA